MNILLVAINAKYIHSSLALRSIKYYCTDYKDSIHILETTINNHENEIIKEIYKAAPNVLGISCYIWNMAFIKTLIPTLKKILPDTTIILGGPEVSYEAENLLLSLDADIIMEGEGEATWKEYLDYYIKKDRQLSSVPGLVYKDEYSHTIRNAPRMPLDLSELPFVYDELSSVAHKIIYYESSRGCPFDCQYCLSSAQSGVRFVPLDRVKTHMQYFLDHEVKQVKFIDRTFNANKSFAMELWNYLITHDNRHTNFHFEIAADLIDDEVIELLSQARPGLFQFEIGVQSTNKEVLKVIKRKMCYKKASETVTKIKALGNIHQHLDLIAGLPLESYHSFKDSFNDVILLRPEQLQLGFLKVLKGSGLRKSSLQYGLVYKDEAPYEVLYTKAITYDEIVLLHGIEEMLERYYNSERFKLSLEYLFICFSSPFHFFEELTLYWEQKKYDLMQHNKLSYYLKLAEFAKTKSYIDHELLKDLIRFDYLKHERLKEIPAELQTLEDKRWKEEGSKLLKDDLYIAAVSPQLLALSSRQRLRSSHIEYFKYDVFNASCNYDYKNIRKLQTPCKILFDYSAENVRTILLNKES